MNEYHYFRDMLQQIVQVYLQYLEFQLIHFQLL